MINLVKKAGLTRQGVFIDNKAVFVTYDNGSTLCVPTDPSNRHYAEVLEWLAKGNQPVEADV
jgi:hypothetical protein